MSGLRDLAFAVIGATAGLVIDRLVRWWRAFWFVVALCAPGAGMAQQHGPIMPQDARSHWTGTQRALVGLSTGLMAADCAQTLTAQGRDWVTEDGRLQHEGNVLLGRRPSWQRIAGTCAVSLGGHLWVSSRLHGSDRTLWLGLVALVEGFVVYSNYRNGATINIHVWGR